MDPIVDVVLVTSLAVVILVLYYVLLGRAVRLLPQYRTDLESEPVPPLEQDVVLGPVWLGRALGQLRRRNVVQTRSQLTARMPPPPGRPLEVAG